DAKCNPVNPTRWPLVGMSRLYRLALDTISNKSNLVDIWVSIRLNSLSARDITSFEASLLAWDPQYKEEYRRKGVDCGGAKCVGEISLIVPKLRYVRQVSAIIECAASKGSGQV